MNNQSQVPNRPQPPVQQQYQTPIQQSQQPPYQQSQAPEQKPKKPWYKKWWIWVIVAVVVIGAIGSQVDKKDSGTSSSSPASSVAADEKADDKAEEKKEEKAEEQKEEKTEAPEVSKEDFIASCAEIDYATLSRNPDAHKGENMKFTGQVIQVYEDKSLFGGKSTTLRINVTPEENEFADGGYLWTDTIVADVDIPDGADRILEKDIIDIYGVCDGLVTYETVLGDNKSLPMILIKYYDIHQ